MASVAILGSQPDLESRIEAFESAWKRSGTAAIRDYLPDPLDASFEAILCELVRVDVELHWSNGTPVTLGEYLAAYPILKDPALLGQIAFEEYRQRIQAGETVSPSEYVKRFGVDIAGWPDSSSHEAEEARNSPPTLAVSRRELNDAMVAGNPAAPAGKRPRRKVAFPKVGDEWHGFKLIDELGHGSFGRVYLARQTDLSDRLVALKLSTEATGECEKLARLQHTNIMPIYSAHRCGPFQAVCMPYLGSTTLAHVIRGLRQNEGKLPSSGRMLLSSLLGRSRTHLPESTQIESTGSQSSGHSSGSWPMITATTTSPRTLADLENLAQMSHVDAVLWIMSRVTDGLIHAHDRGLLHRDLKPANILVTDEGQPMLLDFNLATAVRPEHPATVRCGGTFPYMSPEQLASMCGQPCTIDVRSDLYGLGIILFELLTGRHPFSQPTGKLAEVLPLMVKERETSIPDPRKYNPAVTPGTAAIVRKLLAANPDHRFQTARELRDDLERQREHLPLQHAPDVSITERIDKFRRRHPRLTTAVSVVVAVTVLLVLPVALSFVRQQEVRNRQRQIQSAEARLLQRRSIEEAKRAVIALHSRHNDSHLRREGERQVEGLAGAYTVGDDRWLDDPKITRLSDQDRHELLAELGEAFSALARAYRQESADRRDDTLQSKARRWNDLARTCFASFGPVPDRIEREQRTLDGLVAPAVLEADPEKLDNADLYIQASEHVSGGRPRKAIRLLDVLTRRQPTNFMAWYLKGAAYGEMGRVHEAVASLSVCIALQPEFTWCYYNRGALELRRREYANAKSDLERAIQLDPRLTNARVCLALAYRGLNDIRGAEATLTEVLKQDDAPTRAWFIRAEMRRRLGRDADADQDLAEGMKLEPTDEISWATRGYYRLAQDPHGALADFDEALKLNPRYADAWQNKAHVLSERLNRPAEAIDVLNRLIELCPDRVQAHAGRGVLLARLGRVAEAREEAELCLALDPTPFIHYQMGSLYAQLAKNDPKARPLAIASLREALKQGFDRPELFATEADLDPIRSEPEFQRLADAARTLQRLRRDR